MAGFNGSGTYVREYDWTEDAANGVDIEASRMDTEMDAMATALSTCITKDGQTTITANLPMANFRHTGVGDSSARTHYAKTSQVQDSTYTWAGTTGGSATAYTATVSPAITAYATGQTFRVKVHTANTSTNPTINFNSLGAKTILSSWGAALAVGDLQSICTLTYNGTAFECAEVFRHVANQASMEARTDTTVTVTPQNIQYSPVVAKAYARVGVSGGTPSLSLKTGVTSVTDLGVGSYRITFDFTMSSDGYAVLATPESGTPLLARVLNKTTTTFEVLIEAADGTDTDSSFSVVVFGDV